MPVCVASYDEGVETQATKDSTRKHWRALRRGLDPAQRQAQVDHAQGHLLQWLEHHAPGRALTCVLSYGAEPPTGRLMQRLHADGYRLLVPVCEPERRLSWVDWFPGVGMERSAVAPIDEPVGARFPASVMAGVDLVLVPAQAVDTQGGRLGQGGGYYDRFIASLDGLPHRPVLMAMVFEHEFVAPGSFPVDELDRRVDAVLTAGGITWTHPAPAP